MPNLALLHPNPLSSARILILGGTSGLGAAVSSAALASGSHVFISSSSATNITTAVTHLQSLYPSSTISGGAADLSDESTLESNLKSVFDTAIAQLGGPLDHIVYTAGDGLRLPPVSQLTAKDAFFGWTVRYQGPLMVAKLVASNPGVYLKEANTSSITFTSGLLGKRPQKGLMATGSGALEVMARTLAVELAPVRVNAVIPGAVATELLKGFPAEMVEGFKQKTLVKQVGKPEEAAEAYLFLMKCAYVTAQEIVVDGGASYA